MTGCYQSHPSSISQEEHSWMNKFFRYLLIQECGIYTLWGNKPMTAFEIDLRSEEELASLYPDIPLELITFLIDLNTESGKLKYDQLSPEERKRVIFVDYDDFEFISKWEKWSQKQKTLPIKNYILLKKENPKNSKLPIIFFINIKETTHILQKNYQLFKEVNGEDFNPLKTVCEIREEKSEFWDKVMADDRCRGILFGFGEENAWSFYWKYHPSPPKDRKIYQDLIQKPSCEEKEFKIWTIKECPIPGFASFSENDPVVREYHKQRKKIMKTYKGNDFVELSIKKLTE